MTEVSKALALPSSALLCDHLMEQYGEESPRDGVHSEAYFETTGVDGEDYKLLLIQKGVGSGAVYKAYVRQALDGTDQSIYTIRPGDGVSEQQTTLGRPVAGSYKWPAYVGSNLLYGCFDRRVY